MPTIRVSSETREAIVHVQKRVVLRGVESAPESVRELLNVKGAQLPMDSVIAAGVELLRQEIENTD